ncbi:MAG: hypothetical protein Q7O66_09665, partial [Dehalococcoidia bacterium]|nr:hypothetical protein [Dehalococcoidia bacterium]
MADSLNGQWRNRIVAFENVDPESVLANERNWRIHVKAQQDALSGILGDVGLVQSIIINKRTSELWGVNDRGVETLVDGHLRVQLALSKGQKAIPAVFVDLTPSEEAEILATIDPVAAMAVADKEQLDALLREVATGDSAVQAMLAELAASQIGAFGDTSTDRDGQGVSSTWDQVGTSDNQKVIIGDIETRLPADVVA